MWPVGADGSSPHTRGAPSRPTTRETLCRDHPRIRGEHVCGAEGVEVEVGSSPHTRGALVLWVFCGVYARIIPAYAGSTRIAYADEPYAEDHPRIRGEHVSMVRRCR